MWPLYYNKGIYEPSVSQIHYEIPLKFWNQLLRLRKREGRSERKRSRKRVRNGKGEMWELCFFFFFCFCATGYIYNYLTGMKSLRGFFNKGGRHLQRKNITYRSTLNKRESCKWSCTKSCAASNKCTWLAQSLRTVAMFCTKLQTLSSRCSEDKVNKFHSLTFTSGE